MLAKSNSLDNLIHWHYYIKTSTGLIELYGHSRGMEIIVHHNTYEVSDHDRPKFIEALRQTLVFMESKGVK
jgi:hypothetical protein